MLDRSTSHSASLFRATRAPARAETFVDLVTIELSGHKGSGASFDCEVGFTRGRIVAARTYGDPSDCFPEEGGEVEITAVRPYTCNIVPADAEARRANICPARNGSRTLLTDCIAPDRLSGD